MYSCNASRGPQCNWGTRIAPRRGSRQRAIAPKNLSSASGSVDFRAILSQFFNLARGAIYEVNIALRARLEKWPKGLRKATNPDVGGRFTRRGSCTPYSDEQGAIGVRPLPLPSLRGIAALYAMLRAPMIEAAARPRMGAGTKSRQTYSPLRSKAADGVRGRQPRPLFQPFPSPTPPLRRIFCIKMDPSAIVTRRIL